MCRLLLFAGTTEGRELAQFLDRQEIYCHICVATEYGEQLLLDGSMGHIIHQGRKDQEEILELLKTEQIELVVDATHPYAVQVSDNISCACEAAGCTYLRLVRETTREEGDCVFVDSVSAAVEYLKTTKGIVLAATGSKELHQYTQLPDYRERVVARVLSTPESMEICANLGFQGKNLICMQGPFQEELNYALLLQTGARFLVTKESGKNGGFPEKARAAKRAGAILVVVGRPKKEEGYCALELRRLLCERFGKRSRQKVTLVGIGMGNPENMTLEARRACEEADVIFGAERMLQAAEEWNKVKRPEYRVPVINEELKAHPEWEKAVVLLSGDVGFYSGARQLLEGLQNAEVSVCCGISSVVYLCGKLHTSWEDVTLVSVHGRNQNLPGAVRSHRKVFALVGKEENFQEVCRGLMMYGLDHVKLYAGCDLSYSTERILTGSPSQLIHQATGDLTALLIENEHIDPVVTHGLPDEAFVRGAVPMTKMEIRSISISRLQLQEDSILYDVGAGTGSVSIEMALQASRGMVYAVEKKAEAVELIRENQKKMAVANLQVVEGLAPAALDPLPIPTHAFIGGSSGNLREILETLLKKNPRIRMVINAIALETAAEALSCLKMLPVEIVDISSVSVAKAREIGSYQMMMGQNPVTIFTCRGLPGKEKEGASAEDEG